MTFASFVVLEPPESDKDFTNDVTLISLMAMRRKRVYEPPADFEGSTLRAVWFE